MATFYIVPYDASAGPSQSWILENAPIIISAAVSPTVTKNYGAYTQNANVDVYVATFDDGGTDTFIVCAKTSASVRLMAATGYEGLWTFVQTNTTYNNFQYGTFTGGDRPLTALVPKFDSLNDALAYFDVLINTPSVDVANLSGIFVGSTEIKKVILNGTTVYQKLDQLNTPENVSVVGTMATFDEVENAESYEFFVDDVSIGTYINA